MSSWLIAGGASDGAGGGNLDIISNGVYDREYLDSIGVNNSSKEYAFNTTLEIAKETSEFLVYLEKNHSSEFEFLMSYIPKDLHLNFSSVQFSQLFMLDKFDLVDDLPSNSDAYYNSNDKSLYFLKGIFERIF